MLVADNAPGFDADYLITDADFVEPILDRVFAEEYLHVDELYSIAGLRYQEALTSADGIARLKRRMIERFTHPVVTVKSTRVPGEGDDVAALRRAAQTVIAVTHGEVPNTVQRPTQTPAHAWVEVTADLGLLPGQLLQPNQLSYRDGLLIYDRYGEAKSFFEDGSPATAVVAAQLTALRSAHPEADVITMKIRIAGDLGPYEYVYRVHDAPDDSDASLQIVYPHIAYAAKSARTGDIRIVHGDLAPYTSGARSFYRPQTRNPWEILH